MIASQAPDDCKPLQLHDAAENIIALRVGPRYLPLHHLCALMQWNTS
jgi:hypothetical protein